MPTYTRLVATPRPGAPDPLSLILERLWSLAAGSDDPDIWDDADASHDLAAEVAGSSAPEAAAARAGALAVHYAVRNWLVEDSHQAMLAAREALAAGPPGTAERLERTLAALESGSTPE
jgi:hypothetical protein